MILIISKNKEIGVQAENYFKDALAKYNVKVDYIDDWFDFLINDIHKVEVKSCRLSIKHWQHHKPSFRIGRFDFENEGTRERLKQENVWLCFIVHHFGQHLILGFAQAAKLNGSRYVSIHATRKLDMMTLDEFVNKVKIV